MSHASVTQHVVAQLRVRPDRVVYEITVALTRTRGVNGPDVQQALDRLSTLLMPVHAGASLVPIDYEPSLSASSSSPSTVEESPEAALERLMLEMEAQLVEAKQVTASAIADEKRLARQLASEQELSENWSKKAMLALKADNEELTRLALGRKAEHDRLAVRYERQLVEQKVTVTTLKASLQMLYSKVEETWRRRDKLLARAKRAEAQAKLIDATVQLGSAPGLEVMHLLESIIDAVEAATARPSRTDEDNDDDHSGADDPAPVDEIELDISADVTSTPQPTTSTTERRLHARLTVPLGEHTSFQERSQLLDALDDALANAVATFDGSPNGRGAVSHAAPRFVVDDLQRHRAALVAVCAGDVDVARSMIAQTSIGLEEVELTLLVSSSQPTAATP